MFFRFARHQRRWCSVTPRPFHIPRWCSEIPKAQYGGRQTVTMVPGHGIGPEMMCYVKAVFKRAGVPVDFEEVVIGDKRADVANAVTSIRRNGVAIKGNVEGACASGNVALRNALDLYVNVLNCKSYPGIVTRHRDVDLVIVRQNTEGEYAMLEHESVRGVVESMKVVTADNSERVARFAFTYARAHGRKKVTTVHKANVLKLSDGLFLSTAQEVAKDFPDIIHNDMIVDQCCMNLVTSPQRFDVMVMTNLYGAVVTNLVCGLIGGVGLISGKNFGEQYAVFEPGTRKTGRGIAGKNVANPVAMLNAAVDMAEHLGHAYHARLIREAIHKTINVDKIHTPDLGGKASSGDVVNNIIEYLS